ncbi:MAG: hypothetical protein ACFE9I_02785 [Candidatus Hermodarchaeota archaeon]
MKDELCCTSKDVIQAAIESSNKDEKDFNVDSNVMIIFSRFLLNFLKDKVKIEQVEWLMPFHPYIAPDYIYRGKFKEIPITVLIPPMGASPIASIAEDLIFCGAKTIFLVCGSWGMGENVKLLDYLIPTHGLGIDGTSIHYGRKQDEEIELDKQVINIFIEETKKRTVDYHIGKNYCKEAFYQIKRQEIYELQKKGCISMENGELNVLGTICKQNNVNFGAFFYSYYNPLNRWKIPWREEEYKECVSLEGEIALAALSRLNIL